MVVCEASARMFWSSTRSGIATRGTTNTDIVRVQSPSQTMNSRRAHTHTARPHPATGRRRHTHHMGSSRIRTQATLARSTPRNRTTLLTRAHRHSRALWSTSGTRKTASRGSKAASSRRSVRSARNTCVVAAAHAHGYECSVVPWECARPSAKFVFGKEKRRAGTDMALL